MSQLLAMPQFTRLSYEAGMKITYDATSKRVVIAFRGRITVLPGTYESEGEAIGAGELFCRRQGWVPIDPGKRKKPPRTLW
jgi:hypothetical protein